MRRRAGIRVVVVALMAAAPAVGCGGEDPSSDAYSAENREAFLAACTDATADGRLVRDVCECTWNRLTETVDIEELARLEDNLRLDSLAPLPELVADHMADCLISEADL